jgi:hypothetical protein
MRSSDPASFDQIKVLETTVALEEGFRGLYVTHSAALACTFAVTQITNGTAVSKNIVVNIPTGGGSFLLPVSGEKVTATFSAGSAYALL